MELTELYGKVVKSIDHDAYHTRLTIHFDDDTTLYITAGSDGMHNDRWGTVECQIKS